MAIGMIQDHEGATLEQYDQVVEKMGFTPGGRHLPGCLFHWVTKTDDGIRVVDVWESREQFDRFAEEQIAPFTQEVGFPNPPETTFYEVHNHLTAG
jgi:quinol monooxygenase YgiN